MCRKRQTTFVSGGLLLALMFLSFKSTAAEARSVQSSRAIASQTSLASQVQKPARTLPTADSHFQMVFGDEFNSSVLDTTKWSSYYGPESGDTTDFFDGEACDLTGSELKLNLYYEPGGDGRDYKSCGVATWGSLVQTYGIYEFRARIDPGQNWGGLGLLWPITGSWPPEIDFGEYNGDRSTCEFSLHYDRDNKWQGKFIDGDFTQWHTYTVKWMPGDLRWYVDGVLQFETKKAVPSEPMWFGLQSGSVHNVDDTGAYYVDWVHIYKYIG